MLKNKDESEWSGIDLRSTSDGAPFIEDSRESPITKRLALEYSQVSRDMGTRVYDQSRIDSLVSASEDTFYEDSHR